jgi:cell division transport system ATP-binding protein
VVRLEQLGKRYGDGPEILRGVSLSLAPGSFHFVTGASGAGKTTLLNIIALAEAPSRGSVTLFDIDTEAAGRAARARLRRRIGIVFQDCRLAAELSVAENIGLPLQIDGTSEPARRAHVAELLEWLGLAEKAEERPNALSAAERQRVALARALVRRPDLLLADEPVGEGGEAVGQLLVDTFERMAQLGTTVLVATRATAFAEQFGYPLLHLDAGDLSLGDVAP